MKMESKMRVIASQRNVKAPNQTQMLPMTRRELQPKEQAHRLPRPRKRSRRTRKIKLSKEAAMTPTT